MESNKIIHQIWITDNNIEPPKFIQEKIHNVKTIYSDYQHILWNYISIK
jgi:mannosyltransferase OCH1-like enzyme